jgi:hypothetical protein
MADSKIENLTELTTPVSSDILPIVDSPSSSPVTKKITITNILGTTHTQNIDLADNYMDVKKMSAPSNPATDYGRVYVKQIDSSNDGLFIKIKKGSSFVEIQIA